MKQPQNNDGMNNDDKKLQKLVKMDKKEIEELLKSAMQDYLSHQSHAKIERSKSMASLISIISEYLSAFIIIGYNVNGEPINAIHASNQKDADALSAAINRFIINTISNSEDK